jgi:putative SOS response-associated peptidase YedK
MSRSAFQRNRCLIPASGYYEWHDTPAGKQPYYFTRCDEQPITIAGLWDECMDIETGERLKSCTMIIAEANGFVAEVHDRMPVACRAKESPTGGTAGPLVCGAANKADFVRT